MALQSSGMISLTDIATEFGGSVPHALNEYYGVATGIPASGMISLSDFYGAASSSGTGGSEATGTLSPSDDQSSTSHYRKGFGAQDKCDFYYPESVGGTHHDAYGSLTNTTGLIPNGTVTQIAVIEVNSYLATAGSLILLVIAQGSSLSQNSFSKIEFAGKTSATSPTHVVSAQTNAGSMEYASGTSIFRLGYQEGVANLHQWAWFYGTFQGTSKTSGTSGLSTMWDIMEYNVSANSSFTVEITT